MATEDMVFKRKYRMTKKAFEALVTLLKPCVRRLKPGRKSSTNAPADALDDTDNDGSVPPTLICAVGLRHLAGGSYLDVATAHGISIKTYYPCVMRFVRAVNATFALECRPKDANLLKAFRAQRFLRSFLF